MAKAFLKRRARPIPPNIVLGVIFVILAGLAGWLFHRSTYKPVEVNDFQSCVRAGNPILESYPEQCVHNGQSFINPSQNIPKPY